MVVKPIDKKNFLISGAFVFILSILAMISIFFISGENSIFSSRIDVYVNVTNAQNLKKGAAVQLKGIQVGTVSAIEFKSVDKLSIHLSIDEYYQEWIREDSYVAMKTQGVLGDMFIEILGGSTDSPIIKTGHNLKVEETPSIDKFIGKGEDILTVAGRVLAKIDVILASVEGQKISSILENIDSSSRSTKAVMESLERQNIEGIIKSFGETSNELKYSLESIENITQRIEKGPGSLHSLIYDRSVHDDLQAILGGTKRNKVLQFFIRESIKNKE